MEMIRANNLADVFDALAGHPEALLLAGGTDAMVLVNAGVMAPDYVVSLRGVEDLKRWDDTFIGAGVTFAKLEKSDIAGLAELARSVGSPQIRAAGTIGGNLATASPAGDALPFLCLLYTSDAADDSALV